MKLQYNLLLILISVLALICNSLHAEDACYPDQYPYDRCVDVTALQWDAANSVEELVATSSGTVSVTGGRGPYTWTIGGEGFYFDPAGTLTTIETLSPSVDIHTIDACGFAEITVTSICSETSGGVRSERGTWEVIEAACPVKGVTADELQGGLAYHYINEEQRIKQGVGLVLGNMGTCCTSDDWRSCPFSYVSTTNWESAGCISFSMQELLPNNNVIGEDDSGGVMDPQPSAYCEQWYGGFGAATRQKVYGHAYVEKWVCN